MSEPLSPLLDRQSALLSRLARAIRAWASGRIDGEAFDAIHARIKAEIGR